MEKNLIHSNELHFIDKKRIHRAVEQLVESLELAAGSTTAGFFAPPPVFFLAIVSVL